MIDYLNLNLGNRCIKKSKISHLFRKKDHDHTNKNKAEKNEIYDN